MSDNDFKAYVQRVEKEARAEGRTDAATVANVRSPFAWNPEAYGRCYTSRIAKDAWTDGFTHELGRRSGE